MKRHLLSGLITLIFAAAAVPANADITIRIHSGGHSQADHHDGGHRYGKRHWRHWRHGRFEVVEVCHRHGRGYHCHEELVRRVHRHRHHRHRFGYGHKPWRHGHPHRPRPLLEFLLRN